MGTCPFLCATDTSVLDFWWHILWVSKPEWAALFTLWQRCMWYTFPKIHLWCDTFAGIYCQYSDLLLSLHVYFSRGRLPDSIVSDMLTTWPHFLQKYFKKEGERQKIKMYKSYNDIWIGSLCYKLSRGIDLTIGLNLSLGHFVWVLGMQFELQNQLYFCCY